MSLIWVIWGIPILKRPAYEPCITKFGSCLIQVIQYYSITILMTAIYYSIHNSMHGFSVKGRHFIQLRDIRHNQYDCHFYAKPANSRVSIVVDIKQHDKNRAQWDRQTDRQCDLFKHPSWTWI